jgi:serine/threonine protein kinase
MELLGDNLSELRRKTPTGKFSMATTLSLGIVFIRSLEKMHDLGYLHRDVKPSNFVIGNEGRRNQVFLIDFGLARKFVMPDGTIRPARDQAGFRGTARYASINSHMSRDLGRRDDLWSVLYILIEFAKGFLPWRKLKEKDEIRDVKINMNTPELCDELPKEFLQFMDHLQALDYADRPDYDYLIQLLQHRLKLIGCDEHTPFDWETASAGGGANGAASTSAAGGISDLPISMRPDSAGKPVMSNDPAVAPDSPDPDAPVVYKLVAGGRRGGAQQSAVAASSTFDDEDLPEGVGALGSGSGVPARPVTDSAEDPRRGPYDGSDMIGPEDDDDDNISDSNDKPRPKNGAASTSAPGASSSTSPQHLNRKPSEDRARPSGDQELDDFNNKPRNTPTGTTPAQRRPPAHSSEKCKCIIL